MNSNIIERNEINLPPLQTKMLISGWGEEVYENSVVEKIIYQSDGLKIKGYLAYPKNLDSQKLPCVIWNRGGSKDYGAIDSFSAKGIFGQLASWGYVVFASQYRGSIKGEGKESFGGDDINDVLNLKKIAEDIPFADTSLWGIEGWSRGGMMTYITLKKDHHFKCAILVAALTDLIHNSTENKRLAKVYQELIGENNLEEELKNRSAINFIDELPKSVNYLLIHGIKDLTISPIETLQMAKAMLERKFHFHLSLFEDGDHFLKKHKEEVDELRKYWYKKYLVKNKISDTTSKT
ncbi:MAG: prolyl oligopeptidase family serine peptidase [Ignavibacterium sp.]